MDWYDYNRELKLISKKKSKFKKKNPTKRWVKVSFDKIGRRDTIYVSYSTDNQEGLLYLVDRCGVVKKVNTNKKGQIRSFTVKTYKNKLVKVPYEDGSYTGHYTILQRLE
jgi:hypothetical protein